jgi:hypothetical protein
MGRRSHDQGLDDRTIEQLLTGRAGTFDPELQQALTVVSSAAAGPVPRPTAALADVLDHGFAPPSDLVRRPGRQRTTRSWRSRTVAVLIAGLASVLVTATAQALPADVQNRLIDIAGSLMPVDLLHVTPEELGDRPAGSSPADDAPRSPSGPVEPPASEGVSPTAPTSSAPGAPGGSGGSGGEHGDSDGNDSSDDDPNPGGADDSPGTGPGVPTSATVEDRPADAPDTPEDDGAVDPADPPDEEG